MPNLIWENNGLGLLAVIPGSQAQSVLSNRHHPHLSRTMTLSFLPKNAFPLPAPITPKLVALGLDDKTAATVSKVYLSAANSLKETCETEYIRACDAFVATSDNRGHSSKQLRSKLLTATIARYTQALSKWMDEAVRKAEASVLGRNKKPSPQIKVGLRLYFASRTS